MLSEKFETKINKEKRKKFFTKLNQDEVDVLMSSNDAECLAKGFDRVFLKLLRLIKYSQDRNIGTKAEISEDTYNLLKKFASFVKKRAVNLKMENEQAYFFKDIGMFLDFFEGDKYFIKIHNSIGKTPLEEYNNKSLGEQMTHNMYGEERGFSKSCEGGSCSYWAILFYNFFNKLKEAGLDINVKLYRFKNMEDIIMGGTTLRHSGLIINFQGKDYMVDYEGISQLNKGKIIKPLDSIINAGDSTLYNEDEDLTEEDKISLKKDKKFFENFRHGKQNETNQVIFFDNVDDFFKHIKEFPEEKRISLYVKIENRLELVKFDFIFNDRGVEIGVNQKRKEYILEDNQISKENFINNFIEKVGILKDRYGFHYITQHEKDDLRKSMNIIKDKIDTERLHANYTYNGERKNELDDSNGENGIIIKQSQ